MMMIEVKRLCGEGYRYLMFAEEWDPGRHLIIFEFMVIMLKYFNIESVNNVIVV